MLLGVLWRALLTQALAVGVIFVILLALPLERDFFRDYGIVTGPLAWITASFVTYRLLSLPLRNVVLGALVGGGVGLLAGLAVGHGPGLLLSLAAFGLICASRADRREPAAAH